MINHLFLLISILLGVAFVTLLERKLLSYSQNRKGPNLVGPVGLLQPFSDGMKLLTKKEPHWNNQIFILAAPIFFWLSALFFWSFVSDASFLSSSSFLWLVVLSSLGGMITFLTGWNGGSVYSILGGVRASAQMISYEVVLSFFFMMCLILGGGLSFMKMGESSFLSSFFSGYLLLLPLWLVSVLAETNRAPFDLTEGESELVSGFNTEYSSLSFTLLFLGEYAMILAFSFLTSVLFFQGWYCFFFFTVFVLWVRSCYPRKRYDALMELMWVYFFPLVVFLLCWEVGDLYL